MRFIVIGLGSMGKRRVRNLLALKESAVDIWGYDVKESRLKEAEGKYGINSIQDIADAEKLKFDAAIISTPPDLHMKYALWCAERRIPVFIEASVVVEGLDALMALEQKHGLIVCPSYTMSFFQGPRTVRKAVREGRIGSVMYFTYHSGQHLEDWHPWENIKDYYVSNRITGGCREIVPFELTWLTEVFGGIRKMSCIKNKLSSLAADIDDIYNLVMEFEGGVAGHLCVDVISRPAVRSFRAIGTSGTIEWNESEKKVKIFDCSGNVENIDIASGNVETGYINPEEPYIEELRLFIETVTSGERKFENSLEKDLRMLKYLFFAEKSHESSMHINISM